MQDTDILATVRGLVDEEHRLREQAAQGEVDQETEQRRLAALEESLDQCWDLLRQRRARRQYGQDVDSAAARPVSQVEGYLQ